MKLRHSTASYYPPGEFPAIVGRCGVCGRRIPDKMPLAAWQPGSGPPRPVLDVCCFRCALKAFERELDRID